MTIIICYRQYLFGFVVAIAFFLPCLRTKLMQEATHLCGCCSHTKVFILIPCFLPISVSLQYHARLSITPAYLDYCSECHLASLIKESQVSQIELGV